MSTIEIRRLHALQPLQVRAAVDQLAAHLAQRYGVHHHWQGDVLHVARPGVSGTVDVAGPELRIHLRLGLLAAALKPLIEQEIERRLDAWIV